MSRLHTTLKTAKQRVLKKYPTAYAREGLMSGNWYVYRPLTPAGRYGAKQVLGLGLTASKAWKHAAESL